MLCPECGARNLPEATECVACGDPLPVDSGEEEIDPLIGELIADRYTLTAILGEGSMGVVYAADQKGLDHEVAVKVLHEHVAADPKVKKRFHREARMTSRLSHPNTVRVFDFGRTDDGMLYLAMELLDGPDLLELLLEEEPLSPRRIVRMLEQVLLALEEAHDAGIVHRDLKPENVMVVADHQGRERVKVCDFGIAKLVEAEGSAITVTGFVCGTPEYMAPEQARGEELDPRADIYALGCLLYRMLTGEVPYQGKSALATITQHLTNPLVPPRERSPERHVPRALERVCLKALAKDPGRRYPHAAAMREALLDALAAIDDIADDPLGTHEGPPIDAEPAVARPVGQRPWLVPAAGLAILGLLAGALAWTRAGSDPPPEVASKPESDIGPAEPDVGSRESESEVGPRTPESAVGSLESESEVGPRTPESESEVGPRTPESESEVGPRTPESEVAARSSEPAPGVAPRAPAPPAAAERRPSPVVDRPAAEAAPAAPYRTHFDEGRRRFLANDVAGAIRAFEAAAAAAPGQAPVYKELGRAHMRAGHVTEARGAYRRYLELAPNAADREIVERLLEGS